MSKRSQSSSLLSEESNKKSKTHHAKERLALSIQEIPVHVKAHHIINSKASGTPMLFHVEYECNGSLQFAWWPPCDTLVTCHVLQALYATLINPAHATNERKEHRALVDALIFGLVNLGREPGTTKQQALALLEYYFGTTSLGQMKQVTVSEQKSVTDESISSSSEEVEERDAFRFIDLYLLPSQMASYMWQGARYPK